MRTALLVLTLATAGIAASQEPAPDGQRLYQRTPNHLNPIRRELALAVGFRDQSVAEDACFAVQVFPMLEREAFIDQFMYDYLYRMPMTRQTDEFPDEVAAGCELSE